MIRKAFILAGGKGTRLKSMVSDRPKPMAQIAGKPFLSYLIDYGIKAGIREFILLTGYKGEMIENFFGHSYNGVAITYVREEKPLDTGGAILHAIKKLQVKQPVLILNGDTYMEYDLQKMEKEFHNCPADITIALKKIYNCDRYGSAILSSNNTIIGFAEKEKTAEGWINSGAYVINPKIFSSENRKVFSFEKEYLGKTNDLKIQGVPHSHSLFIDIGIPKDYQKAEKLFYFRENLNFKDYSLFLDRDGVINKRMPDDYVKTVQEFEFIPGAPGTVALLSQIFHRIFIVTNQQGIGKKLMTEEDLKKIHAYMLNSIHKEDGVVDAIYFSPHLAESNPPDRKPATGMAMKAATDYPEIDLSRSIMIGDSPSDIEFGETAGMITILINKNKSGKTKPNIQIHSLQEVWSALEKIAENTH